ncbi:Hypothetical predicted protein, partial [Mytilus galloprovincialis]
VLTYRRMVKKKDLVKIFFIYMCLYQMVPAHPCGENPLRSIISLSSQTGQGLRFVLDKLKQMDYRVYRHLQSNFQRYAECVGMVDTGYFKRSDRHALISINPFTSLDNNDDATGYIDNSRSVDDVYKSNDDNREQTLKETQEIISKDILPMLLKRRKRR